ncbi:MAG: ribonuclease, partial [Solirubrobacteraceae bacterium]
FDLSIDVIGTWARDERREGAKVMFQALAEKRIGRRDQANAWIWRLAEYTREVHEEYAVQRWPETKRLLGLLVNSSGGAHARNARRLVHAARKQDRRLQAALLAAAVAHTPEAEEVLRGARTRLARKPSALSRELLRNFPKGKGRRSRRRRKKAGADATAGARVANGAPRTVSGGPDEQVLTEALNAPGDDGATPAEAPLDGRSRGRLDDQVAEALESDGDAEPASQAPTKPRRSRRRRPAKAAATTTADGDRASGEAGSTRDAKPARAATESDTTSSPPDASPPDTAKAASTPDANGPQDEPAEKPKSRRTRARSEDEPAEAPEPRRTRARKRPASDDAPDSTSPPAEEAA